ncbi:MAG TPA: efflux RND transporter periplasmic adaptor subunit [Hanamia sp.]|nr:efflux RND transporter periplasmic adaptor subunit [Hanamia sp.]
MVKVLSVTVLISCLTFISCKEKQQPPPPKVPVNLYTVSSQPVIYYDQYPSTTEALSQVNLLPQVQGYVRGIFFKEGSKVEKGQKLYEIDQSLYDDAYKQAVANLKVAQGTLTQSQQDADRYVYLNKYHAVAKQLYDHAMITLDNAKNSVKAAEQTVSTAKTNLGYSIIYAPFNGTIGFSQVKMGNLVVVGQTILNTISTNNPMAVDFYINEKQILHFEEMQQDKNNDLDSLFTILLPNNELYPYVGKISIIDRAVDPQTGTIRVRLIFPNPNDELKAGMSCVVRVHNQDRLPQIVIPNRAVVEQMGEYFVFVAKDTLINRGGSASTKEESNKSEADTASKGPQLLAFEKKIQLGQTVGANIVVTKGLVDGETIVVDGVQKLHDGVAINPGKTGQPGNDNTSAHP